MSLEINSILVVIDPTSDVQPALTRACVVANTTGASVLAYVCCFNPARVDDESALERAEVARHTAWLQKIVDTEKNAADNVAIRVEWNAGWREAVAAAAAAGGCDLIVKATHWQSQASRRFLRTSDWEHMRAARCPVLFIKHEHVRPQRRILMALNVSAPDAAHQRLNDDIISVGKQVADSRDDIELHAVNAYPDSDHFVHPPDLAERAAIERRFAHCIEGAPGDVISEIAGDLEAELVILGTVSRTGMAGATKGNTAERALDRIDADVLTIPFREVAPS
ncbi:MAG TPA: universal stress protein [Gammaproteobacteria bacterium]|nr:universal stress protein [Gammaproteobacteria bacterium]